MFSTQIHSLALLYVSFSATKFFVPAFVANRKLLTLEKFRKYIATEYRWVSG